MPQRSSDDVLQLYRELVQSSGYVLSPQGAVSSGSRRPATGMSSFEGVGHSGGGTNASLRTSRGVSDDGPATRQQEEEEDDEERRHLERARRSYGGTTNTAFFDFRRTLKSRADESPLMTPQTATQRTFFCWLCETTCADVGWRNAPELYTGTNDVGGGRRCHYPSVSSLTLCARCSAACSLPDDAPNELVLRKAGKTRALAQRSELFVQFVRKFKRLLEILAAGVAEMTVAGPRTHFRSNSNEDDENSARSSLWDFRLDVQWNVMSQLMDVLASALEAEAPALCHRSRKIGMSFQERDLLKEELAWLEAQWARMHQSDDSRTGGRQHPAARLFRTPHSGSVHRVLSPRSEEAFSSGASHYFQRDARNVRRAQEAELRLVSPSTAAGHGWRRERRSDVCRGEGSRAALDKMMERALTAELRRGDDGVSPLTRGRGVSVDGKCGDDKRIVQGPQLAAGATRVVPLTQDSDDILMRYFEGQLEDLPRINMFSVNFSAIETRNAQGVFRRSFRTPRGALRRSNDDPASDAPGLSPDAALTAADVSGAAPMDATFLLGALRAEQRRRERAEEALREGHRKIADLEMATDRMCGLILEQDSVVAHIFGGMQEHLRVAMRLFVDFAMQKSLLFSDEMFFLMRQTQHEAYGAHRRFPQNRSSTVRGTSPRLLTTGQDAGWRQSDVAPLVTSSSLFSLFVAADSTDKS